MALAGSLHLSSDLGICKNQWYSKQFKSVVAGRGQLHLLSSTVSLRNSFQRQDSLNFHLADNAYRPIRSIPYRYNGIRCHSSLGPGKTLRTAALELARSLNTVQGGSPVLQLVPAAAIITFTVWGLGPLLRLSRNLLFHKNDSSWKKSNTYYVMTSYLRPLLLWAGATLIFRALDLVDLPSKASQIVKWLSPFIGSSYILVVAYCLSRAIQQSQKFFTEAKDTNDTRKMGFDFAVKAANSLVWVAAISLFMELLGFSTQKWLTAGGLGTVLLTLAGREIFTNFLSSAMIHATRPFVVNEWIQTRIEGYDVSGTVEHVGWWSPTIVRGEDREAVHIPNHKFTMNVVRNLTQKTHWRIKTHLAISHLDVHKINNIVADMRKVLAKNPQVEQQRLHRRVFLENINQENQALLILVSCFVKTSHYEEYLCVKEAIMLDLLRVISHHRARLATPIRTVQKIYSDADLDNVPFADSMFNRAGVANRPLLLIEPPSRINGEDKIKTQPRSTRTTGEQDSKSTARSTSDNKVDAKVGEKSPSDMNVDSKSGENPGTSSSKDLEAAVASKPVSKTNSTVAEMSASDSKALHSVPDGSTQNLSQNNQPQNANPGSTNQSRKSENPLAPSTEIGADRASGSPATSQLKQEGKKLPAVQPPITRPALEENIILGVALEGSKRTLPIDEELTTPAEGREMAAQRNKNVSASAEKDKKDSQIPAAPGATPNNQ